MLVAIRLPPPTTTAPVSKISHASGVASIGKSIRGEDVGVRTRVGVRVIGMLRVPIERAVVACEALCSAALLSE